MEELKIHLAAEGKLASLAASKTEQQIWLQEVISDIKMIFWHLHNKNLIPNTALDMPSIAQGYLITGI